jgi:AcrR family transcriptional regulator
MWPVPQPAYTRLSNDERRAALLERGVDLFARYGYDELSMARFAREAGISKALLYHYFPSKRALFEAVLEQAAGELAGLTEVDPSLPPAEQLAVSLDAFLGWIDEHRAAYAQLMASLQVPEVRELIEGVREETAQRILAALGPEAASRPATRTAVRAWLWFMDGACLDWVGGSDLSRDEVSGLLLGTLLGALTAAGAGLPAVPADA